MMMPKIELPPADAIPGTPHHLPLLAYQGHLDGCVECAAAADGDYETATWCPDGIMLFEAYSEVLDQVIGQSRLN